MSTLIIGDIHGRSSWKHIIAKHPDVKRVVFVGDYFDNHEIHHTEQVKNFKEIIALKLKHDIEVILLIGNHDHQYFTDVILENISRFQNASSQAFIAALAEHRSYLQMAFQFHGDILVTHAGVGQTFLRKWIGKEIDVQKIGENINTLFLNNPLAFKFNGVDRTGDDITNTPIWIRPKSLMLNTQALNKYIIQIVGHTRMDKVKNESDCYYFIDTLSSSCEYLLVSDTGKINIQSFHN